MNINEMLEEYKTLKERNDEIIQDIRNRHDDILYEYRKEREELDDRMRDLRLQIKEYLENIDQNLSGCY